MTKHKQRLISKSNVCKAIRANGEPCRAFALRDSDFCFVHDPAHAAQRAAARRKGGHNRRVVPYIPSEQPVPRLRTPDDVLRLLESEIALVVKQSPSLARARVVISAALAALKVLEVSEIEHRLAALEEIIGLKIND